MIICRLTKERHYVPTEGVAVSDVTDAFLREVYRLHGLPDSITSDRGTQFNSDVWRRICQRLGISVKMSTSFHHETAGQPENANASMKAYLRQVVAYS